MLFAKLLGGKGTIAQMLAATSLYAVPHVLDILGFITCVGPLFGLVATLWGIGIYIKGLAVANDFGIGKAALATILPALLQIVLITLGMIVFFFGISFAG
jgi:hypothetical protein